MNVRGEAAQAPLYFIFFLMMLIIGLGIALGVFGFFGEGYDARFSEAEALMDKINLCMKENNVNEFFDNNDKFFEVCRLDKEVLEDGHHLVYIKNTKKADEEFFVGVYDFTVRCGIAKKNSGIPVCDKETVGEYEILVGTDQNSWRVTEK